MKNLYIFYFFIFTQTLFATIVGEFSWEEQMKAVNIYVIHVKKLEFSEKRTGNDKADKKRWLEKLKAGGIDVFAYCDVTNNFKGKIRKNLTVNYKVHPATPMQQLEKNKSYMVFLDKNNRPLNAYNSFIHLPNNAIKKKQPTPKQTLIVFLTDMLNTMVEKDVLFASKYCDKYSLKIPPQELIVLATKAKNPIVKYEYLYLLIKIRNQYALQEINKNIKNNLSKIPKIQLYKIIDNLISDKRLLISIENCCKLATIDAGMQYYVSYLLRKTKNKKALPILKKMLDSDDRNIQYNAYVAISSILNKSYAFIPLFEINKKKYIDETKKALADFQKR